MKNKLNAGFKEVNNKSDDDISANNPEKVGIELVGQLLFNSKNGNAMKFLGQSIQDTDEDGNITLKKLTEHFHNEHETENPLGSHKTYTQNHSPINDVTTNYKGYRFRNESKNSSTKQHSHRSTFLQNISWQTSKPLDTSSSRTNMGGFVEYSNRNPSVLYVGLNRVVGGLHRSGEGLCKATITLFKKEGYLRLI